MQNKYFRKKIIIYLITFFFAVTLNWLIPRFMPGDPMSLLMAKLHGLNEGKAALKSFFLDSFGLNKSFFEQYLDFWKALFTGDFGVSIYLYPKPVIEIISKAAIYDIVLLLPAVILSWIFGNKLGAISGVNKKIDNILMPIFYFLTSSPYFWFAVILVYVLGVVMGLFPINGAYSSTMLPSFSFSFIIDFFKHWILPFLSLFSVMLGGWAIGMRNMIIYEMGSNYSKYMEALGSSKKLIRKYAFRNAELPQVTGLALSLGTIIAGNLTTQIVFSYPGLGYTLLKAILNQDYFLVQGCFLFIIIGVLLANFLVDILYMFIDPRVRYSYSGEV
ncbi:peptide ABC transporter permease [Tepiditoga spiralis]|uniref:Peptide ABC transporter permease n=1 Tax=Tepiditoga spiralis TaxID=2108365 RepID=A0A7G1GBB8_9BACT|nr:ABC transporter permease [Tepiditoga spiralis]BBE31662.1 peptide ABC transporter permease [Tepiditoga spiralis]